MLGISIYLSCQATKKNELWIQKAQTFGVEEIFTSLHIPEEDSTVYKHLLQTLGKQAKQYGMNIMADISPKSFQYLGINHHCIATLLDWGVSGLRIDDGFSAKEIANLSQVIKIALNASTVTENFLQLLEVHHFNRNNAEAWHNFYPRPETGLSKEYIVKKNRLFQQFGIRTVAFIPGDGEKRGPIYQGLPTLEKHRSTDPLHAYLELVKDCFVDKVFIGDISATDETLRRISQANKGVVSLRYKPIVDEERILSMIEIVHTNRLDPARDVIRSMESRLSTRWDDDLLKPSNTLERRKGSITIDNILYGRYAGELQITLTDLPQDARVNVVGHIIEEDLPLLSYIKEGTSFQLERV